MINPNWNPTPRQLRQFAAGALAMLLLLAVGIWRRTGSVEAAAVPALLGAAFGGLGFFVPRAVRPFYRFLSLVGLPIGYLVSEVFLRLVFYGVLTPLGLIFKMAGRDVLKLKRVHEPSYWRPARQQKKASGYFRQA